MAKTFQESIRLTSLPKPSAEGFGKEEDPGHSGPGRTRAVFFFFPFLWPEGRLKEFNQRKDETCFLWFRERKRRPAAGSARVRAHFLSSHGRFEHSSVGPVRRGKCALVPEDQPAAIELRLPSDAPVFGGRRQMPRRQVRPKGGRTQHQTEAHSEERRFRLLVCSSRGHFLYRRPRPFIVSFLYLLV
jgi:hypothetical protein